MHTHIIIIALLLYNGTEFSAISLLEKEDMHFNFRTEAELISFLTLVFIYNL